MNHLQESSALATGMVSRRARFEAAARDTARGERIAAARKAKHWTHTHLANACAVKKNDIADLEAGGDATPERFHDVADALGIDVTYLMLGRAPAPPRDEQQIVTGIAGPDLAESLSVEPDDAEILALGRELEENRAVVTAEWDRAEALEETNPDNAETRSAASAIRNACRPLGVRYQIILNQLRDKPAFTHAEMAVKGRAILHWLSPGGTEIPDDHEDGRVAWSLARDVLRMQERQGARDAALIAVCDRYAFLERQVDEINERPATRDDDAAVAVLVEPIRAEQDALLDRMDELRASTPAGIHARTRALYVSNSDRLASMDGFDDMVGRQVGYLFRDVAALGAGAPTDRVPPSLDAELKAACAEFDRLEYAYLRLYYGPTRLGTDEERDAAEEKLARHKRQDELLEVIRATRATTLEGLRAKARTAATWDLELLRPGSGTASEVVLSSLVRDLVGDYDPIASLKGREMPPARLCEAPVVRDALQTVEARATKEPAETAILAIGRRLAEAAVRQERHDQLSMRPAQEAWTKPRHTRMSQAAFREQEALRAYACGLPAQTLTDVLIQLESAAVIAEGIAESDNGLTGDASIRDDFHQVVQALASAIRVLVAVPDILPPEISPTEFRAWEQIKFAPDELPPVLIGNEAI